MKFCGTSVRALYAPAILLVRAVALLVCINVGFTHDASQLLSSITVVFNTTYGAMDKAVQAACARAGTLMICE